MGPTRRRLLAYGLSTAVVGGLVYVGFVYEAEPDPMQLLSSLDIQIRLAGGMPEKDKDGVVVEIRAQMLRDVRRDLERVEMGLPNSAQVREYRAFLSYLEGDTRGSAEHYRVARGMDGCSEVLWGSLVINEVRMLRLAGDLDRALEVLVSNRDRLQKDVLGQADLHQARILDRLGRTEEAVRLTDEVGQRGAEFPMAAMEAGGLLETWQRMDRAEVAYLAASEADPTGHYYHARLKIRMGDVDRSMGLLELAVSASPAKVRALVNRDVQDWEVVAETKRFRTLVGPEGPASSPGR